MSNSWKVENIFNTYEEAEDFKNLLQQEPRSATLQFKIQRNIKEQKETFVVKSRTDPSLVAVIKEVDEHLLNNKDNFKNK